MKWNGPKKKIVKYWDDNDIGYDEDWDDDDDDWDDNEKWDGDGEEWEDEDFWDDDE